MNRLLFVLVCIGLMFGGCAKEGEPISVAQSKDDFRVTLLFEVDGVKVYRFYDAGRYRYFAVRNSAAMLETEYSERSGKNTAVVTDGTVATAVE